MNGYDNKRDLGLFPKAIAHKTSNQHNLEGIPNQVQTFSAQMDENGLLIEVKAEPEDSSYLESSLEVKEEPVDLDGAKTAVVSKKRTRDCIGLEYSNEDSYEFNIIMDGIHNRPKKKRSRNRVKSTVRWSKEESDKMLAYVNEDLAGFEKPTVATFYKKLAGHIKVDKSWVECRDKMRNLRTTFKKAKDWLTSTGEALLAADPQRNVMDYVVKLCPYYYSLRDVYNNHPSLKAPPPKSCTEPPEFLLEELPENNDIVWSPPPSSLICSESASSSGVKKKDEKTSEKTVLELQDKKLELRRQELELKKTELEIKKQEIDFQKEMALMEFQFRKEQAAENNRLRELELKYKYNQ